jgi:eukaryotic-like serine/threonine-protein kinase
LPPTLSSASGSIARRARFSGLEHPHICALYDVGHDGGVDYLVMQYVEGETLADRIGQGALPLAEALRCAIEIAGALDKAHRQGIVHRDLKPSNVMLTKGGAKLLDFGLAKMMAPGPITDGVTRTTPLTGQGTILGTLQYMAPEQLEGKEADARTDIFAFGTLLYEMVTGRRAFGGASQASVIGSILKDDPSPVSAVQPLAPASLDHVVQRCLAKDSDERWQSARDIASELQWIAADRAGGPPETVVVRRRARDWVAWGIAGLGVATAAVLAAGHSRHHSPTQEIIRLSLLPPTESTVFRVFDAPALSPDGRSIVFSALEPNRPTFLWIRALSSLDAKKLDTPAGASDAFWSPDSRFVAFEAQQKLWKIDTLGGSSTSICDMPDGYGGSWNRDNIILFTPDATSQIFRVPAGGGRPEPVTVLDQARQDLAHWWPHFLPDGRHFLFFVRSA